MLQRLLLWDIDGTLVRAGAAGAEAFDLAVRDVVGEPPGPRIRMSGKTDWAIVSEQLGLLGVEPTEEAVAPVLERLAVRLAAWEGRIAAEGTVCPGVREALVTLGSDDRVVSGLVTGNLERNAHVKLRALGLEDLVDFAAGAYGSDAEDRNALVPIAMERTAARYGAAPVPSDVWVIGDTPRDLDCARAAGARCLLVATGVYRAEELAPLRADAFLDDLSDTEGVVKLLTADL